MSATPVPLDLELALKKPAEEITFEEFMQFCTHLQNNAELIASAEEEGEEEFGKPYLSTMSDFWEGKFPFELQLVCAINQPFTTNMSLVFHHLVVMEDDEARLHSENLALFRARGFDVRIERLDRVEATDVLAEDDLLYIDLGTLVI